MENNLIGNVPNLSAEMENDISLMSTGPINMAENIDIDDFSGVYSLCFNNTIFLHGFNHDDRDAYDPEKIIRFEFSAPRTISVNGDIGYNNPYDITLKYIGVKIPYFLSQNAYSDCGNMIDCTVSLSNLGDSERNLTAIYRYVYTFSYMQFSYRQKENVANYLNYGQDASYTQRPYGNVTVIYALDATTSSPYGGYTIYNDEI